MKKTISMILCAVLLAGCSSTAQSAKTASTTQTVKADTVTGASTTRTVLSGDDYDAAMTDLEVVSNDLATKAETEKAGYEEKEDDLMVKAVSYGEYKWFSLSEMWDTGYDKKGGMILYHIQ